MKTKQVLIILLAVILIIAVFTNPNEMVHKEKVKSTITAFYKGQLEKDETVSGNVFGNIGNLLGISLINKMIENLVSCDDYLFFSITKITFEEQEKSIGFGVLGHVFISDKVEEAFNKV
jgi:hypothetical protein